MYDLASDLPDSSIIMGSLEAARDTSIRRWHHWCSEKDSATSACAAKDCTFTALM